MDGMVAGRSAPPAMFYVLPADYRCSEGHENVSSCFMMVCRTALWSSWDLMYGDCGVVLIPA